MTMYLVTYRNEDGSWYLAGGALEGHHWTMDPRKATRHMSEEYATQVAWNMEAAVSRDPIRGSVKVIPVRGR